MKGNCHYLEGNLAAERRINYVKALLDEIGLGGERLEMHFLSSAEGSSVLGIASPASACRP